MKEMKPFYKDKVVCIAGAHSAIGKSLAIELNKLKAIVILMDYKKKPLKEIKKDLIRAHVPSKIYKIDYQPSEKSKRVFNDINQKFGRIDILFNLTNLSFSIKSSNELSWSNQLIYNVEDTYNIIEMIHKKGLKKKKGQIVNFVRLTDILPSASNIVDTSSAYSIIGLTQVLREHPVKNIQKVSVVYLGTMNALTSENSKVAFRNDLSAGENRMNIPQHVSYILKGVYLNEVAIFEANWSKAKWMFDLIKPVINFRFLNKWKRKK